MLTHVSIMNYKPIRHLELDLEPLTVFIGPNDSGKSSILQAVHSAAQIARGQDLEGIFTGANRLDKVRNQATDEPISFDLHGRTPDSGSFRWSFKLVSARDAQPALVHEGWSIDDQMQEVPVAHPHSAFPTANRVVGWAMYLHFAPDSLKQPSYSEIGFPHLERDGSGLPSVLDTMLGLSRDHFEELEERFVEMVPTVRRILVAPEPVFRNDEETIRIDDQAVTRTVRRRYTGHHLYFDTVSGQRIPAQQMSDGSMILLGYLTALLSEPQPKLFLIEEPESGLHPHALEPLVGFFRDCLAQSEDLQILMSSHSPYLVDHLKAQELILTRRNKEGFTEAARLSELPDIERWLENLSPGELWTMGGEEELIRRIRQKEGGNA